MLVPNLRMGAADTMGEKTGLCVGDGRQFNTKHIFIVLHSLKQLVAYQDLPFLSRQFHG